MPKERDAPEYTTLSPKIGTGLKTLLTYKTAAAILDCSASKVQKMVLAGEIPYLKVGNETRIREEDLERWIREQLARHCSENCREDNRAEPLPREETRLTPSKRIMDLHD